MKVLFECTTVLSVILLSNRIDAQQLEASSDISSDSDGPSGSTAPSGTSISTPSSTQGGGDASVAAESASKDAQIAELNARIDALEDDMERMWGEHDALKTETGKNRIYWSGSSRMGLNTFHLKDRSPYEVTRLMLQMDNEGNPEINPDTGQPAVVPETETRRRNVNRWMQPTWVHRLRLGLSYNFGDVVRFYARLSVFKYFNEIKNTEGIIDLNSNAYPRDSSLRLERVYVDWFPTEWLALSVGRISASDGPPSELKENTERLSGWGIQMIEAEIEVAMVTFHLKKLLEGTYLRFFYSPFGIHDSYIMSDDTTLFDEKGISALHGWGALFETKIPHAGDNIIQFGAVHVPKFTPRDVPIAVQGTDEVIWPSGTNGDDDLGTFLNASALLLFKDIGGSGLDLFGAYALTYLKPREGRMIYDVTVDLPIYSPQGDTGRTAAVSDEVEVGLASFEEGNNSTNLGHLVYGGLRYTPPLSKKYPTRIGGEFNWGSKYHIAWSAPSDQLVNKLSNKGWAWEAYLIQQLMPRYMFLRVGYIDIKKEYQGLYIGPTTKVDQRVSNIYLLFDLTW